MPKPDPLAAALDALAPNSSIGGLMRIDALFGDRPELLAAIRRARFERKLSYRQIATFLSQQTSESISANAVSAWLDKQKPPA